MDRPAVNALDQPQVAALASTVGALAQGFYWTRNESYAQRAAQLLRAWFLDPATRMNPNLNFGQAFPGVEPNGTFSGLIETDGNFIELLDSVALLQATVPLSVRAIKSRTRRSTPSGSPAASQHAALHATRPAAGALLIRSSATSPPSSRRAHTLAVSLGAVCLVGALGAAAFYFAPEAQRRVVTDKLKEIIPLLTGAVCALSPGEEIQA
jgi:hypothetical protein